MHNNYTYMNDQSQSHTRTEQEFRELQDDLNRANARIKTYKDMEKNFDTAMKNLKKKIEKLEAKPLELTPNSLMQDKQLFNELRVQELSRTVEHLSSEIAELKKANDDLKDQKKRLEKKVQELKQTETSAQTDKEATSRLEKEIDGLKQELEKNKLKEAKAISSAISKQSQKVKKLEKQLAQARKQISELQAASPPQQRPDTPNSKRSKNPQASTLTIAASQLSQRLQFMDGVNLDLQFFEDDRTQYPSTHKKILDLIEDYLSKLQSKFQIPFLNLLSATAEAKIEMIDDILTQYAYQRQ